MSRRFVRDVVIVVALLSLGRAASAQDAARSPSTPASQQVDALAALKRLAAQPVPARANEKDRKEWARATEWLESVVERASVVTARERASGMATGRSAAPIADASASAMPREASSGMPTGKRQHKDNRVYASMRELQDDVQAEARQFNTLSNASKARHDMAMSAIRNLK